MKEWTHVVVSYDGSSRAAGLKVFLNGNEAPLEIVRDQLTKNCGSASAFTFGERVRDNGLRGGAVDDIRIFTRPISGLEVKRALSEQAARRKSSPPHRATPGGLSSLRSYYFSAADPEIRAATARSKTSARHCGKTIDGVPELPVMKEMAEARPARLLARGAYDQPEGDPLPRATPAALPPFPAGQPRNRLGLARWLIEPSIIRSPHGCR